MPQSPRLCPRRRRQVRKARKQGHLHRLAKEKSVAGGARPMKAVVFASAHVAPHGTRTKRFAAAAESFNSHPQATTKTDGKHLRDLFFLLKDKFEYDDEKEAAQSGNDGAVTKLDDLLIDVVEKFNDFEERERAAKGENT